MRAKLNAVHVPVMAEGEAWLPLATKGPNGSHGHWAALSRRRKSERRMANAYCPPGQLPCVVTLTRYSAGTLDDDNLRGALKGVRDGVSDRLGVPDNDPRLRFEYAQAKCARGLHGVSVRIHLASDAANDGDER